MPKQFIGAGMGGSLLMVDNTISTYDRGGVGNHIHKFGYNPDVDVFSGGSEDIVAHGGLQWFPSAVVAAADIRVYSSSANDTSNGTHARTITIVGLDGNYHEQTEVVTLAGTVVAHPLNDYIRIDRAYISTSGTAYTNAGNITIDNTANIFVQINTGLGQSLKGTYTIPANYEYGYLEDWQVSCGSKQSAFIDVVLQIREFGGAWRIQQYVNVSTSSVYQQIHKSPPRYPAKTDIRLTVIGASADNLPVTGAFNMRLE